VVAIACVLFPDFTQLDLTGPYEVFHRLPDAVVHLAAAGAEPVESEGGLAIVPTLTFDELALCDVLFVPGGPGVDTAMLDEELIGFVQRHAARASWVTSACTGSLILGALIERAREAGCHSMLARITSRNVASVRLHERHGFRVTGVEYQVAFKLGRWHDVTVMQVVVGPSASSASSAASR